MDTSVYFRAMEMNRQTLGQRISATIRAKQHLVFFAFVLAVLDFGAPLLADWLNHHRSLAGIIADGHSLFETLNSPGAVGVAVGFLLLTAWLRSGYIRSLVGTLHMNPQNGLQFASMVGLQVVTYGWYWLSNVGQRATASSGFYLFVYAASMVAFFALLYADFAIVVSGLDPVTAIRRSWKTAISNLPVSVGVLLGANLVLLLLQSLLIDPRLTGSLADMLLLLAVRELATGGILFVTDVILVMVYIDAIESGAVPFRR